VAVLTAPPSSSSSVTPARALTGAARISSSDEDSTAGIHERV